MREFVMYSRGVAFARHCIMRGQLLNILYWLHCFDYGLRFQSVRLIILLIYLIQIIPSSSPSPCMVIVGNDSTSLPDIAYPSAVCMLVITTWILMPLCL